MSMRVMTRSLDCWNSTRTLRSKPIGGLLCFVAAAALGQEAQRPWVPADSVAVSYFSQDSDAARWPSKRNVLSEDASGVLSQEVVPSADDPLLFTVRHFGDVQTDATIF